MRLLFLMAAMKVAAKLRTGVLHVVSKQNVPFASELPLDTLPEPHAS